MKRQLPGARHADDRHVLGQRAVANERIDGTLDEAVDDEDRLNRLATMPNRAPFGTTKLPSITRVVIRFPYSAPLLRRGHRVERNAL